MILSVLGRWSKSETGGNLLGWVGKSCSVDTLAGWRGLQFCRPLTCYLGGDFDSGEIMGQNERASERELSLGGRERAQG